MEFLESRFLDYKALLPKNECPEGYERNVNGKAMGLCVPDAGGYYQPAEWVKRLPDGKVAGLPRENGPGTTPYVAELFAQPDGDDDDDDPILDTPPWLLELFRGTTAGFATLMDEAKAHCDWGMQAELERLRSLKHAITDLELRVGHLLAKKKGAMQAHDQAMGRLERAKLDRKVSSLRTIAHGARTQPRRYAFKSSVWRNWG
jgi:hypothetical protein